jgi:hypothetical protein
VGTLAAALMAARFRAVVDAVILPRLIQATAIAAVGGAMLPRPLRAAAILAAEAYTPVVVATPMAATMPAEVTTTAAASGLVLTMASGLASPSVGATIPLQAAVTMTHGVIGTLLRAMRTYTPVTNRTTR